MTSPRLARFAKVSAAVVICVAASELLVRISGITDFPLYITDPDFEYMPAPNQTGNFLHRNHWVFNDVGMTLATPWDAGLGRNVLLIGNSIVQGGNPLDQKDRLGSWLQADLGAGYQVWPIAAGGWSTINEVAYLSKHQDVADSSNFFVWEYMAGGLSGLSQWRGEYIDPTHRPTLASWYVLRRYLLSRIYNFHESELPPTGDATAVNGERFEKLVTQLESHAGSDMAGVIFLYPEANRLALARSGQDWLPERKQIEAVAARHRVLVIDIASQPDWNETLYRDGTHPTAEGNRILGKILTDAMRQAHYLGTRH